MVRTSLKKNKNIILLCIIVLLLGIIFGTIYCYKLKIDLYSYFDSNIIHFNIYHIIFCFLVIFLNYIYIGPLLALFNMFLEGLSIGMIFYTLIIKKKLKGLIFSIIVVLFGKLSYLIIILILCILSLKYIFYKEDKSKYLNYNIITLGVCFASEIAISFITDRIWDYFCFLIK